MPITLPETLPAHDILSREGVNVMSDTRAARQDIRPLQIELSLIKMTDHHSKNTATEHMEAFYQPFQDVKHRKFDGLIITGAPIEHLEFGDVTYWDELREIMDWTQTNVHASFGVCWGGMAMINHFHGIDKHLLDHKAFGCFPHRNFAPRSHFLLGFSDEVLVPVSRWTEMRQDEIDAAPGLTTLLGSEEVGTCLVDDPAHRALYVFNHFEYDNDTLKQEYDRDVANGTPINVPANYYPEDDPARPPMNRWRSHAHLLYGNWINKIYQTTPFDLAEIGTY